MNSFLNDGFKHRAEYQSERVTKWPLYEGYANCLSQDHKKVKGLIEKQERVEECNAAWIGAALLLSLLI